MRRNKEGLAEERLLPGQSLSFTGGRSTAPDYRGDHAAHHRAIGLVSGLKTEEEAMGVGLSAFG